MRNWFLYAFFGLIGTLLCFGAVAVSALRVYEVPTNAMEPSLRAGDRLLDIRFFGRRSVKRGQIVAFYVPYQEGEIAIRRVLGLPGDRIQVRAGRLVLNGTPIYEPYVRNPQGAPDFPSAWDASVDEGEIRRLRNVMYGEWVRNDMLTVPEGQYFVLADNRGDSFDSRNYGPVPQGNVLGKPLCVFETTAANSSRRVIDSYFIGAQP